MKPIARSASAVLALMLSLGVARASGPIGVYALVDQVSFEPNPDKPERVRVSGVFIVARATPDNSTLYMAPRSGYLYFALPKDNEELARREWADLKSVAGTRQVVGFGGSWNPIPRVRKPDEAPKLPDDFPLSNGVIKINSDQPKARELLDYKGQ
jgi:hypothetical protein